MVKAFTYFVALAAFAASAVALPHKLLKPRSARAVIDCGTNPSGCPTRGPSGSVVYPYGGTEVQQTTNGGDGLLFLNYTTVFITSPSTTFTQSVNVSLVQNGGGNARYHLAALGAPYPNGDIVANLALPAGACGVFNLYIEEQQYTELSPIGSGGGEIKFLAAAPLVQIDCTSFEQSPPTTIVYTNTQTTMITESTTAIATHSGSSASASASSSAAASSAASVSTPSSQPASSSPDASSSMSDDSQTTSVPTPPQ